MRPLPLLAAALAILALALPATAGAIVGGQPATRPYPFMGALLQDGSFECGASLVGPDLVLTAGHCVTAGDGSVVPASSLRVQLGSHQLSKPGETLGVTAVTREPQYDAATASYDLALLKLERPAHEAPIRIAAAPDRAMWAAGAAVTVIGWGTQFWPDAAGLTISDGLREVQVPVRADDECASSSVLVSFDAPTMLCAGETTGGKDACNGDSGGPLMSIAADGTPTLVGVVSQGTGCGYPTQYGVYARAGEGPLRAWLDGVLPKPAPPPALAQAASTAKPKPKARHKAKAKAKKHHRTKHRRHARRGARRAT